jgi:hypothetical protein
LHKLNPPGFEIRIENLKTELFQMSQHYLRSGWHRGFDDYYYGSAGKSAPNFFTPSATWNAAKPTRIALSDAKIAEGKVRVHELKVA